MDLTRRQFVIGSVAGIGSVISPAFKHSPFYTPALASEGSAPASFATLNCIGYGPTPALQEYLTKVGLKHYLEEQFHPASADDRICNDKLAKATLHIEYKASEVKPGDKITTGYPALSEDRPLMTLGSPIEDLWKLTDFSIPMDGRERNRPALEVRAATWIRAVYSKWQLREVMAEFWHNHFNVQAFADPHVTATLPVYDGIIRRHCFGNFRDFLEDVAKSAAMQYYLNNVKSKASPANENYARELFELHTLGADHYYNDLYNRWREVPGATKGRPIGYIDQDVYEAARAFTGWTIEDGTNTGRGTTFAKTGKFVYFDGWHDNYQKRVLGTEFDPNSPPLADGRKVLDLVSAHPGTAMYVCTKLCRRLVSDNPPPTLVRKAAQTWQRSLKQPDQIKRVLETIILSPEFAENEKRKVKRPFEYVVSFLRATDADFMPREDMFNALTGTGYRQFEWPTPTGHPDVADYWLNTNTTLSSWNIISAFISGGFKGSTLNLAAETPSDVKTSAEIISYWTKRLTGKPADAMTQNALMQYMPIPSNPNFTPDKNSPAFKDPLQQMVMVIAMSPDFQVR